MPEIITPDILFFFDGKPVELEMYEYLASQLLERYPSTAIKVQKTQISFCDKHMYACVSFAPVRRKAERPECFITVTFGLTYPLDDPRALAVAVRPNRWTHHVIVRNTGEIDGQMLGWIDDSHNKA